MAKENKPENRAQKKSIEKPLKSELFTKKNLASISDNMGLDSALPFLADAVGVPLIKSVKIAKDFYDVTKDKLKKVVNPEVKAKLQKELAEYEFIISKNKVTEWVKSFNKGLKESNDEKNHVLEKNIDEITRLYLAFGFTEKNREWLDLCRNGYDNNGRNLLDLYQKIARHDLQKFVPDLVSILKSSVPVVECVDSMIDLLIKQRNDRAFTERENQYYQQTRYDSEAHYDQNNGVDDIKYVRFSDAERYKFSEVLDSSSFSKQERVDIIKKYSYAGFYLIMFVDSQRKNKDFKFRKNFIFDHIPQFLQVVGKVEPELDSGDDILFQFERKFLPKNFSPDLLESGSHLKILEELRPYFEVLDFKNVDSVYLNKYGERFVNVLKKIGVDTNSAKYVVPAVDEVESVLSTLEKCKDEYTCEYLKEKKINSFKSEDKEIIDNFGWISDAYIDWRRENIGQYYNSQDERDKDQANFMLKVKKPENQRLIAEGKKILDFILKKQAEDSYKSVLFVKSFRMELFKEIILDRGGYATKFTNDCLKYPELFNILFNDATFSDFGSSSFSYSFLPIWNDFFERIEDTIHSTDDLEKLYEAYRTLRFISEIPGVGHGDITREMLGLKDPKKIDILSRNSLFIENYFLVNGLNILDLAVFPLELVDGHQDEWLLLAEKYGRGVLGKFINYGAIKNIDQLKLLLTSQALHQILAEHNYIWNGHDVYKNVPEVAVWPFIEQILAGNYSKGFANLYPVLLELSIKDPAYLQKNYLKIKKIAEIIDKSNSKIDEFDKDHFPIGMDIITLIPKNANLDKVIEIFEQLDLNEMSDFHNVLAILSEGKYGTDRFNELCEINAKYSAKMERTSWLSDDRARVSFGIPKLQIHATIVLLESLQAPKEYVEEFVKKARSVMISEDMRELIEEYFLTDPLDDSDLREFDFSKLKKYEVIFDFFRKQGMTISEENFIKEMSFEKFKKGIADQDIFTVEESLNWIGNNLDVRIKDRLEVEIFLKKTCDGKFFSSTLGKWVHKGNDGKNKAIDVTQKNIKQINAVLRFLLRAGKETGQEDAKKIAEDIQKLFPDFESSGNIQRDISWLAGKFDVQEINFKFVDSFSKLVEVLDLLEALKMTGVQGSAEFLQKAFDAIDFNNINFDGNTYSIFKIQEIENLRDMMNSKSRVLGDMLIDKLGSSFLEKNCCDYDNLPKLLGFAEAWENPPFEKDVKGIYDMYSSFAYVEVATFLKSKIEAARKSGKEKEVKVLLKARGLDYDDLVKKLEIKGVLYLTEGNVQKAITDLKAGNYSYVFRKGTQKLFGGDEVKVENETVAMEKNNWSARKGVETYVLKSGDRELAVIIKCDPAVVKNKILVERDGVVDMEVEEKNLGAKLIFSAPMTFTTGNHKMTELAFRDGEQMNYLLSPHTKDGLLLVSKSGEKKVLNKTRLKVSDFLNTADLADPGIDLAVKHWAGLRQVSPDMVLSESIRPAERFVDKKFFFEILKIKEYSLLGGMLLIDKPENSEEGIVVKLNDNQDSRRLYLEFADGKFGIFDSTENMSTARAVELALSVGATKAMYMDTGMYDMATYKDGGGSDHVMGHQDTKQSTNRVMFYEK